MTQYLAANIAQRDREVGLGAHFLQVLLFSGKLLDYIAVVGDDFSAEHPFAGRARQLVVEVLVHAATIPHREHMHACILVAEMRNERIAGIECLCQPLDQRPKEISPGLGCGSLIDQPEDSKLSIVGGALLLPRFGGFCILCAQWVTNAWLTNRRFTRPSTEIVPRPYTASIANMKPHKTCWPNAASKPSASNTCR